MVHIDRRWREFAVPCHGHWHELQPGGQAEAIDVLYLDIQGFTTHALSEEAERTMIQL